MPEDALISDPVDPRIRYRPFDVEIIPIEVTGFLGERSFVFRSRYDRWGFAVTSSPDVDAGQVAYAACGLQFPARSGFTDKTRATYYVTETYGDPEDDGDFSATYMPREDVLKFIRQCAAECLEASGQ